MAIVLFLLVLHGTVLGVRVRVTLYNTLYTQH